MVRVISMKSDLARVQVAILALAFMVSTASAQSQSVTVWQPSNCGEDVSTGASVGAITITSETLEDHKCDNFCYTVDIAFLSFQIVDLFGNLTCYIWRDSKCGDLIMGATEFARAGCTNVLSSMSFQCFLGTCGMRV
jgi:hypothetical protein